MGGAAVAKVRPRLGKAESAIDGQPHLGGIAILLAVVLPPAHRAKLHALGCLQGSIRATRAAIDGLHA